MNAKGEYLRFWYGEKTGRVGGSEWGYIWEDSIHEATLKNTLPSGKAGQHWKHGDNPAKYVVAKLEATVETTRVVTLIKEP